MIDESLLAVLACPKCDSRPPLLLSGSLLICTECGWGYRIQDGIPNMLVEEALSPKEVEKEKNGNA